MSDIFLPVVILALVFVGVAQVMCLVILARREHRHHATFEVLAGHVIPTGDHFEHVEHLGCGCEPVWGISPIGSVVVHTKMAERYLHHEPMEITDEVTS